MRPELVEGAVRKSLADWKLNYFDLYLIHWPFAFKTDAAGATLFDANGMAVLAEDIRMHDTWRAMERLVELGLVRSIGVSNYSVRLLQELLAMPGIKIRPAVNQVELHPYLPQIELRAFCKQEGIVVEAYSSLGSGKEPSLLEDATILEVAKAENISPSSVLLSWARQQGIAVIPKSSSPVRVRENIRECRLSEESMAKINSIDRRHRFVDPMTFWKRPMPE
jgi:alcohol dehydrogenase (NADP+)